jgi:glutamine cyclotransferase
MDNVAYRLSLPGLRQVQAIPYPRQGWGLTSHRGRLVASDGTATLRWLSIPRLRVTRSVVVRDGARPVFNLNELEVVGQYIWANLWQEDRIAIIRPGDGRVLAYLDLSSLRQRLGRPGDVLNGIARDPVTGDVLVTGKFWDRMFVIRLDDAVPA